MTQQRPPLVDAIALSKQICEQPIIADLKYAYEQNFVGRPIAGYEPHFTDICLLAPNAALMLCQVQNYLLKNYDLGLLVFDAYRPLRAVKDFANWFDKVPNAFELQRKAIHYPHLVKQELAQQGYIADKVSNHCYGSTVDLTLIDPKTEKELNLGTCFDYFGEQSHTTRSENDIGTEAYQNRKILTTAMQHFNFQVHPKEYWHFDFEVRENLEPLDIEITRSMRGIGIDFITEFKSTAK